MASKPGCVYNFGISLAEDPLTGQAVSGVKVARVWSAAATRNVGRRVPIWRSAARKGWWVARGSASSSRNCEALSTDADTLADRLVVALKPLAWGWSEGASSEE